MFYLDPKPGQRRPRYNGSIDTTISSLNPENTGMIGWFFEGTGKDKKHGSIIAQLYDSYSADVGPALHKQYVTLSFFGWRVRRKIEDAAKQIVSAYQILTGTNGPMMGRPGIANVGLDLLGYSRGAVMALEVAHALDKCSIPVRFLGMLDPVSTGFACFPNKMPKNVIAAWLGVKDYNKKRSIWDRNSLFRTNLSIVQNFPSHKMGFQFEQFDVDHVYFGWDELVAESLWHAAISAGVPLNPRMK